MAITLPADSAAPDRRLLLAATQARQEILARTGLTVGIERPRNPDPRSPSVSCRLDPGAALSPRAATARDAYRLEVRSKGVVISAPTTDGLRHGLQTFCQLATKSARIANVDIVDQPDFRDRGIMLDVSRGKVPTQKTLEELIDFCSRLRLNILMLYVEHTFDFRRHPEIGKGASPLDANTLLALDGYAADRGVELIPCLQSLGHMERILAIGRYAELAESDRLWSLSPSHPGTYALLEDLYDEFLPLFGSKRFNANCDEPFDLGRGQSAKRSPRKSPGRLFADHVQRLHKLSSRHDKQLMVWADFAHRHPDELSRIDQSVVLIDWWYEESFDADRLGKLRRKGFEVWASPGTSTWNCLFPRVANSTGNIARWSAAGRKHGATGLLNTDWGDFGHYNALGVSLHSYAWGAQHGWSGDMDTKSFERAFGRRVFGDDNGKIGRLYRRLGDVHEAGFPIANGSALQALYFDALGPSFFLQHCKRSALEGSSRKLAPILRSIRDGGFARSEDDFVGLARQEIAWAADATRLAVDKGLAAVEYNHWRSQPKSLTASARRRLAQRFDRLAEEQAEQLYGLQSLWLARSEISDFESTRKRLQRSIAGLRTGARRLRRNTPPRPPKETKLDMLTIYDHVRREMGMRPR
jgi:hexosaminidase